MFRLYPATSLFSIYLFFSFPLPFLLFTLSRSCPSASPPPATLSFYCFISIISPLFLFLASPAPSPVNIRAAPELLIRPRPRPALLNIVIIHLSEAPLAGLQ